MLKYFSTTGTGPLKVHVDKCLKKNQQTAILSFAKRQPLSISSFWKEKVKESCTFFACTALKPFKMFSDPGLLHMAQTLIDFGSSNPGVRAKDIIPGRNEISKNVETLEGKFSQDLNEMLKPLSEENRISFSADMWSDRVTKEKFLDISVHFVDIDFKMVTKQLKMVHFPESHTADAITEKLSTELKKISQSIKFCRIVTDSGANIKKSVNEKFEGYQCFAHRYNTSLETGFKLACSQDVILSEIESQVTRLICYVNKADLNNGLPIRLKSGCQTRPWRHFFEKYNSICESYDALLEKLGDKQHKLNCINKNLLFSMRDFFKIFKNIFDLIECVNSITAHLALPVYYVTLEKLTNYANQCEALSDDPCAKYSLDVLSNKIVDQIKEKVFPLIKPIHYAATLLDPETNYFEFIPDLDEKTKALKTGTEFIKKLIDKPVTITVEPIILPTDSFLQTAKRTKITQRDPIESEIDELLKCDPVPLCSFWKNQSSLRNLKQAALQIFSLTLSSSGPERHFSSSGKCANPERSCLKPYKLCSQVFVGLYLRDSLKSD